MVIETIQLDFAFSKATLLSYVLDTTQELKAEPRPAVIICPGGAFVSLSEREGEPIASAMLRQE